MKTLIVLLITLACIRAPAQTFYATSFSSQDQVFRQEISTDDLAQAPSWGADSPNPPLAPREAARIARELIVQLIPETIRWDLVRIGLRPSDKTDKWFYEVEFRQSPKYAKNALSPLKGIGVFVLMNGKPPIVQRERKD